MHLKKTLEQLGFTKNMSAVYLASLELGEATISEIAQRAGIPRTSCQTIIRELKQAGLLNFYAKRRRKYWIAENPDYLMTQLRLREAALKEALPELRALKSETGAKPSIRFYGGADGVWQILDDIIETKHPIRSLTSLDDVKKLLGEEFNDFIVKRYSRHLPIQFLTVRSPETETMKLRDERELRRTRFLPNDSAIRNANFIYGSKTAIISLNKKMPVGIIIEDQDIAETQTILFDSLWREASE
jgi:HTH-type transcriptional regulator, sugar sensing transcriptional regulator